MISKDTSLPGEEVYCVPKIFFIYPINDRLIFFSYYRAIFAPHLYLFQVSSIRELHGLQIRKDEFDLALIYSQNSQQDI